MRTVPTNLEHLPDSWYEIARTPSMEPTYSRCCDSFYRTNSSSWHEHYEVTYKFKTISTAEITYSAALDILNNLVKKLNSRQDSPYSLKMEFLSWLVVIATHKAKLYGAFKKNIGQVSQSDDRSLQFLLAKFLDGVAQCPIKLVNMRAPMPFFTPNSRVDQELEHYLDKTDFFNKQAVFTRHDIFFLFSSRISSAKKNGSQTLFTFRKLWDNSKKLPCVKSTTVYTCNRPPRTEIRERDSLPRLVTEEYVPGTVCKRLSIEIRSLEGNRTLHAPVFYAAPDSQYTFEKHSQLRATQLADIKRIRDADKKAAENRAKQRGGLFDNDNDDPDELLDKFEKTGFDPNTFQM